jgi:ferredoxin
MDTAPGFDGEVAPDGAGFVALRDQSLLQSLEAAGIPWPSACRNGTCRTCLGRLTAGEARHTVPWPGLSAEENAEHCVLPCVAQPLGPLVLHRQPAW